MSLTSSHCKRNSPDGPVDDDDDDDVEAPAADADAAAPLTAAAAAAAAAAAEDVASVVADKRSTCFRLV